MLKKGAEFLWSEDCEKSFEHLKTVIADDLVLAFPSFDKEFYSHTDASSYTFGAVLSQYDNQGNLRPITFASKTLNSAEQNYATIQKELYAIIWPVKHFHPYLACQKFTGLSDHKPLRWAFKVKDPSSRLIRWKLKLAEHDYFVNYIAGKENGAADAFSRIRKVLTRRTSPNNPFITSPFEHRPMASAKRIVLLISIDLLPRNRCFSSLTITISKK